MSGVRSVLAGRLAAVGLAVLIALSCAALWRSAQQEAAAPVRVQDVAASLRCPDCQTASAAESSSPLAQAMRAEIGRRLALGWSADRIRDYFQERYGPWILRSPPAEGLSLGAWALPVAVLAAGCLPLARRLRRARGAAATTGPTTPAPARHGDSTAERSQEPENATWQARGGARGRVRGAGWVAALLSLACGGGVLAAALAGGPSPSPPADPARDDARQPDAGGYLARGRALQAAGDAEQAVLAFEAAAALRPDDRAPRYLLGFALVKAGRAAEAVTLLRPLRARHPDDPDLLLVLGTAELTADPPAGRRTLARFLSLAPEGHPAVPEVRRLLEGNPR
ncbi:Tetratricopeptide repeat-containing protein [Nonomuraea pusilla]|uniref:Cytochrome c-type biogenesis protein n=1 Tax=Nonomuraea pusilla TaxID=46177 RepID=A0A1H7I0I3_9ACTN|nr:Tetratricopeptide repeat-containing protein [Nonomuraea pusilla]